MFDLSENDGMLMLLFVTVVADDVLFDRVDDDDELNLRPGVAFLEIVEDLLLLGFGVVTAKLTEENWFGFDSGTSLLLFLPVLMPTPGVDSTVFANGLLLLTAEDPAAGAANATADGG